MRGQRERRPPWQPPTRRAPFTAGDEAEEDDEEEERYLHHATHTSSSGITLLSPIPAHAPAATASNTSSSLSAYGADLAAAHRPLRPPPPLGAAVTGTSAAVQRGDQRVRRARQPSSSAPSRHGSRSSTNTTASSSPSSSAHSRPPSVPLARHDAAVPVTHWRAASTHARGAGAVDMAGSSALLEHYHVLELEEQLRYWRQRALHVEGRALRRERALQSRWEDEFAAAQAASESLIRKLLDKQRRLQHERQQREADDGAGVHSADTSRRPESTRRGCRTAASADSSATATSRSAARRGGSTSSSSSRCSRSSSSGAESDEATARTVAQLRRRIADLEDEKDSLRMKLAEAQSPHIHDDAAAQTTQQQQQQQQQLSYLRDLCHAAVDCVEHGRELRGCHAVLLRQRDAGASAADDDAPHEERESARVTEALHTAVEGQRSSDAPRSSTATTLPLLHALSDALVHLDAVLLTCVDDAVLVGEHMTRATAALAAAQQSRHPPGPARNEEHREAEGESRLREAREALVQERHRCTTLRAELDAAVADANARAREHQAQLAQRSMEWRDAAARAEDAHRTALQRTHAALEHDVADAARRVSAAEHNAMLHAQREEQWRTRLTATAEDRDAYAEKCAVLQGRLDLLQCQPHAVPAHASRRALAALLVDTPPTTQNLPRANASPLAGRVVGGARRSGLDSPPSAPRSPSRSLSYSPAADTRGAPPPSPPPPAPIEPTPATGDSWGSAATSATSTAQRLSSAPPVEVMQPSRLAVAPPRVDDDREHQPGRRGGDGPRAAVTAHMPALSASTSPVAADTPLARMRRWESKFQSILHPA
ncbi:hypothetical protein NESM_000543100 [Novymonas esmeraldas]|uniref:Uncharacterized protein n=1 Tax=Novymonas esmeraldas TaxID=1808958 RepID=A0AAW0ERG1_9TRYP